MNTLGYGTSLLRTFGLDRVIPVSKTYFWYPGDIITSPLPRSRFLYDGSFVELKVRLGLGTVEIVGYPLKSVRLKDLRL